MNVHEENIEYCRTRLARFQNTVFFTNSGHDFRPIADCALTAIFCYDAMVHFSPNLVLVKADLYRWGAKHELDRASNAFIAENGAAQATRLSKINRVRPIHLQIRTRNGMIRRLMRENNSGRTMRLLCLGVSTLPVLYLSMFIYRFASPLPVHDQWVNVPFIVSMKEGRTSLSLLVQFHDVHLIVIPRLFYAVLACLFTWDNRLECWVTFVFTVVSFSLLCRVAVKAAAKGERIAHVALIPISLFLFGTNQWQNWLVGWGLAWQIPVLALIASIASLSRSNRLAVHLTVIILATAVAVLSLGNGLLVPLILSVILLRQYLAHRNGKTLLELAVAVALVVVSLSLLISHISHRPHSPMYSSTSEECSAGFV